jgi:flagellar protein FlaI
VELPQRNWVASVTRPSFADDEQGEVDEFDLLEAALRQRPEYIVMGEIRGEEGRTLFQVMSTGHTTLTTFHADSVGEVLKRFTTEPINVSKTMFTALDLVSIQTQTRVGGRKVRRNKNLTEINFYDAENDEINVQDVYQWQAETDEFLRMSESNTLEEIRFDRGWTRATLEEELFKREVVLAYLIENGLNTYTQVAATVQAFINDEETILALMSDDRLERSLEDLREMESVLIDIDPEKEAMVPRPDPGEAELEECAELLDRAETELFDAYRGRDGAELDDALAGIDAAADVTAEPAPSPPDDLGPDDAGDGPDPDAGTADLDGGSPFDDAGDDPFGTDEPASASTEAGREPDDDGGFDISFGDGGGSGDGSGNDGTEGTDDTDGVDDTDADPTGDSAADIDEWGFGDVGGPADGDGDAGTDEGD